MNIPKIKIKIKSKLIQNYSFKDFGVGILVTILGDPEFEGLCFAKSWNLLVIFAQFGL